MGNSGPRGGHPSPDIPGGVPADLAAVVALLVLADLAVLAPVLRESPVRVVLGLAAVLVLPGYALVAALFPAEHDAPAATRDRSADGADGTDGTDGAGGSQRGIDGIERAALSVALSIPVVSLVGLGLALTPFGVALGPVLLALNGVTLGATAVATWRRRQLPAGDRFRAPVPAWAVPDRPASLTPDSRTDLAVNAVLAASILLAAGSVTFAVVGASQGETYTELYLLTENGTGDLVADDYPTEFTAGESRPVIVGIENHEGRSLRYTVVVQLQRLRVDGTTASVVRARELERFDVRVGPDSTWRGQRSITPTMTGERLRVAFLLYRGGPPPTPSVPNAYRYVGFYVTVR